MYENVSFVLRIADQSNKFIRQRVPYVLNLVERAGKAKAKTRELSGGEQQRVAIARALANDPNLLIVDEPTGNLDPELSYELVGLLKEINRCGTTVVMITHEHELVRNYGGRIINIEDGSITFDETIGGTDEDE